MNVRVAEWSEGVRWADLVELTKPRITLMVVLTTALGAYLAGPHSPFPLLRLVHALVGVALLAGGAAALNQVVERQADARMRRTAQRPIPAGRLDVRPAWQFGVGLSVMGLVYLFLLVNPLTMMLGAVTLVSYLFLYTPLKKKSPLATVVGAVPGAIPPMMGWTAMGGEIELGAWILFGILFLWQLPHSLAIAWLYREDYGRGGFRLLPVKDDTGKQTSWVVMTTCVALVAVTLLPWPLGLAGLAYVVAASLLGIFFLGSCATFAASCSMKAARRVMLVSVFYLPAVLTALALDRWM